MPLCTVLRIVVRNGFTRDLAGMVLADLRSVIERPVNEGTGGDRKIRPGFHH